MLLGAFQNRKLFLFLFPTLLLKTARLTTNSGKVDAFCTKFGLNHVQKAEKIDAFCTKFGLNHVQKAEKIDAFCTKFGLNHVQKAENCLRAAL